MEKLIELLTEYKPQADLIYKGGIRKGIPWDKDVIMNKDLLIISKQFGFIERLVQNDKIDFRKADADISKDIVLGREPDFADFMVYRRFLDEEKVLMLLAISDNPIEDLISYLR